MHVSIMTYTNDSEQAQEPQIPENSTITPNKARNPKNRRNLFMALGGGALVTTLIVVGAAVLPKGERGGGTTDAPRKSEGTSQTNQPANPTPEATSTPEAQTGSYEFTGKVAEQTKTVGQMDAMSLNEFALLPYADRLAYTVAKEPGMIVYSPGNDAIFNLPQDIPGALWQSLETTSLSDGNTTVGAKSSSANLYYTAGLTDGTMNDSYKATSDSILATGGQGVMDTNYPVFKDSGKWQSGTDRSGNPIDFINITSHVADTSTLEQKGSNETDQVVRQVVKLLDGRTIIYYPRAFGVYGKKSPIDGGTY